MEERQGRLSRLAIGVVLIALAACSPAVAKLYAPLDQPGPPLDVAQAQLKAALQCEPTVSNAKVEPVLFNPGTGATPTVNFAWNWEPALDMLGIPWCAYTAPHSTLDDIQTSGEYLVYAIRTMHALAHRRIAIIGHSQGGMSMRWALRFWPDARAMVDDVIGFAGSNHGTTVASASTCAPGCPPANWQQIYESTFIQALNSRAETFPGISYTNVYSHRDEVVNPDSGPSPSQCTSCLFTGHGQITNVATQDSCPGDPYEHLFIGTVDPVAYALAVDALTHAGPADPSRISSSVCSQVLMPGVSSPQSLNGGLAGLLDAPGFLGVVVGPAAALEGAPVLTAEPPLACYVFATCTGTAAPTLRLEVTARRARMVRVRVRTLEGDMLVPVPGVTITLAGHHVKTGPHGLATLRVRLESHRTYRIRATRAGCNPAVAKI
jgi:pimeloyl-ACP methyl ester carboxylesterase